MKDEAQREAFIDYADEVRTFVIDEVVAYNFFEVFCRLYTRNHKEEELPKILADLVAQVRYDTGAVFLSFLEAEKERCKNQLMKRLRNPVKDSEE